MLTYDPDDRISAEDALNHPWIENSEKQSLIQMLPEVHSQIDLHLTNHRYLKKLINIFKSLDKNGDGVLSKEEIQEGFEKNFGQSINQEQIDKMFEAVDLDNSGFIDCSEFVLATACTYFLSS